MRRSDTPPMVAALQRELLERMADGKGRAMGFLNGNETPDFTRYEEMLREAEEELLRLVQGHN